MIVPAVVLLAVARVTLRSRGADDALMWAVAASVAGFVLGLGGGLTHGVLRHFYMK